MNVFSFSAFFLFSVHVSKDQTRCSVFVKMIQFQNDVAHNLIHEMTIELAD